MDQFVNRGKPPDLNQNSCFFRGKKEDAEIYETEKYAKIFCDIFARVSVKRHFTDIFIK